MDQPEKDFRDFMQELSRKEISYEEQLDRQKTLLLARKEVEHWKRLLYETERFHEQYLREDRLDLKQVYKQRNLFYRINNPRLKIVIDQDLDRWVNEEDGAGNKYQTEISKLRKRLDRVKQQAKRYKDVFDSVQESKSHRMVQESTRKVREEEARIEAAQKAIDELWMEGNQQANKEWNKLRQMIVDFSRLCTESNMMDLEKEAILQNNEIKRVKIVQLHEDIAQARIEQEEEAKRREVELSERILIPLKIAPMTLESRLFKNPNDFPALIDKIESTRKSYEQIFKRPEYMDLRKMRKKHKRSRSKTSAHFEMLFGLSKRKVKIRKSQLKPSATTVETAPKPVTTDEVQAHEKVVAKELPSTPPAPKLAKPSVPTVERQPAKGSTQSDKDLTKSQPLPVTNEAVPRKQPPVTNKRKASVEFTEDQHKPICNVKGQRTKQRSAAQSKSQPEAPAVSHDNSSLSEPPRKRPSLEKPVSASAPAQVQDHREFKKPLLMQERSPEKPSRKPRSKKVAFKPQPEPDSFSFSPEKSDRKPKPNPKQQLVEQVQFLSPSPPPSQQREQPPTPAPMDIELPEQPQQTTVEDDNFSFGSASPPLDSRQSKDGDGGSFFDTGSISSFEMEDRESGSDLGFDLSPVGPRTNSRRDGNGGEGSGSDGNTSDFDFLASPPKSGAPPGSQGSGRKGQDCFAFTDDDDSGTGFDFF